MVQMNQLSAMVELFIVHVQLPLYGVQQYYLVYYLIPQQLSKLIEYASGGVDDNNNAIQIPTNRNQANTGYTQMNYP